AGSAAFPLIPFTGERGRPLLQRAAGAVDAGAGLAQLVIRGRVGDAEMRRQAEGRAMHDRDALGLQEVAYECLVIVDRGALGGMLANQPSAGRVDIEGAFGARAIEPRHLVQQVDDEVAALLEQKAVLRDEILRAVERLDRRGLADRAR